MNKIKTTTVTLDEKQAIAFQKAMKKHEAMRAVSRDKLIKEIKERIAELEPKGKRRSKDFLNE